MYKNVNYFNNISIEKYMQDVGNQSAYVLIGFLYNLSVNIHYKFKKLIIINRKIIKWHKKNS